MVVAIFAIIVATIFGCKKDNEVPCTEANDNNGQRNPIAVYDNNSGMITTLINVEALTTKFNKSFLTNKNLDNCYVAESVEVLDSMPYNKDVRGELKITLLDTEEECSYSIWCMKDYVVKDVKEQQVDYYLDENVENGNYDFAFKEGELYYAADFVGDSLSIHQIDSLDYGCRPKILFICKSRNCEDLCSKGGKWYSSWCRRCPTDGDCEEMGIIAIILDIFM